MEQLQAFLQDLLLQRIHGVTTRDITGAGLVFKHQSLVVTIGTKRAALWKTCFHSDIYKVSTTSFIFNASICAMELSYNCGVK